MDGIEVPFRGDGVGFSYRVPVDPDGSVGLPDYLDGLDPAWGAVTRSGPAGALTPSTTGWCVIVFEARNELTETELGADLNKDGDEDDVFEQGRLLKITWDTLDPTVPAGILPVTVALSYRERVSVKNYTSTVTPLLVFGFILYQGFLECLL